MSRGQGWAYTGAILGGVVSIAANVAHSYVPPEDAAQDWSPQTGAVIGAVFWPLALFVAIEILAKVAWPAGRRWVVLRYGGLVPVALVAAVVSYRHLSGLLAFYGEDGLTVALGPLAVDGLMVMATGALIALGRTERAPAEPLGEQIPAPVSAEVTADPAPTNEPLGEQASEPTPSPARKTPARRSARADSDLLTLLRPLHKVQPLSRHKVMKLTDVSARQAQRLVDALATGEAPRTDDITAVNGHERPTP